MKTRAKKRNDAYLMGMVLKSGAFKTILNLDFIYVANEINDLTAAFSLELVRRGYGVNQVNFYTWLTVIQDTSVGEQALKNNLECFNASIVKYRSLPLPQWRDKLVDNDRLSDGLIGFISVELQKYTLDAHQALALMAGNDDEFISAIRRHRGSHFDDLILNPLMDLAKRKLLDSTGD